MGVRINPFTGQLQLYTDFDSNAFVEKIKKLQNNLIVQAFHLSILQNMTLYNLDDGIIDEYEDTSGVNLANTTALYDNTNKNYCQDYEFLDEMNYSTDEEVRNNYSVEGGISQKYKKAITLQGHAGLGTDCQVKMLIGESSSSVIQGSIFSDDFSGDLSNWAIINGSWAVSEGILTGTGVRYGYSILTNQVFDSDVEISVKMKFDSSLTDEQGAGITFRSDLADSISNAFFFGYKAGEKWVIRKAISGSGSTIVSQALFDPNPGTWYVLKVRAEGTSIKAKVWEDGQAEPGWQFDITSSDLLDKKICGLTATDRGYSTNVSFDDFLATPLTVINPDFHLEGNSEKFPSDKGDGGDLKFFNSTLDTELPFWVEEVKGTSPNRVATVWVKVLDNLDSDVTINCFYGDSSSSNNSDPENTFIFFDDFDGSSLDTNKWTIARDQGSYSVSNSKLRIQGAFEVIDSINSFNVPFIAKTSFDLIATGTQIGFNGYGDSYSFYFIPNGGNDWYVNGSARNVLRERIGNTIKGEISISDSGQVILNAWDEALNLQHIDSNTIPAGTDITLRLGGYSTSIGSQKGEIKDFDYVYVRKYVSSEPQILSVGIQEPASYIQIYNDTTSYKRGTSSFKMIIAQNKTLNNVIKRVYAVSKDLSDYEKISFFVKSDYSGNLLSLLVKDENGSILELPFIIDNPNTWELKSLDFTGSIDKTKVKEYGFKILEDSNPATFNLDYVIAQKQSVLESQAFTADFTPDTVKVILRASLEENIPYNDYITVEASRDGGTSWNAGILTIDEDFGNGSYILTTEIDVSSQPSGSSIVYKVILSADYFIQIEGVGLLWY